MQFSGVKVIANAARARAPEKAVVEGILESAYLTDFQRDTLDGIVKNAMPEKRAPAGAQIHRTAPEATKKAVGFVHFPGSRYR